MTMPNLFQHPPYLFFLLDTLSDRALWILIAMDRSPDLRTSSRIPEGRPCAEPDADFLDHVAVAIDDRRDSRVGARFLYDYCRTDQDEKLTVASLFLELDSQLFDLRPAVVVAVCARRIRPTRRRSEDDCPRSGI